MNGNLTIIPNRIGLWFVIYVSAIGSDKGRVGFFQHAAKYVFPQTAYRCVGRDFGGLLV